MENKKDTMVTINLSKAREKAKKALKTMLVIAFFLGAYMIICKPGIMNNLLTRTERAVKTTKTKEVEIIYMVDSEYITMYNDNSYAKTDSIEKLAVELTDNTGKQYAEDGGRLKMFDGGKIVDVDIIMLKH